jgi:CRISPR-associated protein Csd2
MSELTNKIDFAVVFSVTHANPNGDPINGNRPRETYDGLKEEDKKSSYGYGREYICTI